MSPRASRVRLSPGSVLLWGLLAASSPGCLGGFTGDAGGSDGAPPTGLDGGTDVCRPTPLGYEQEGRWGVSAAELVEGWGGVRDGTLTAADAAFVQALGLDGASLPPTIKLGVSNAENGVTEDSCTGVLAVSVAVFLEFGEQEPRWEGIGTLTYGGSSSRLRALLLDDSGDEARRIRLELSPVAAPAQATLTATGTDPAGTAAYRFD